MAAPCFSVVQANAIAGLEIAVRSRRPLRTGEAEESEQGHGRSGTHIAKCRDDSGPVNKSASQGMNEPADTDDSDQDGGPPRGALIALLVIVVLVAGGLWLAHTLHGVGRLQDCVMAGRTNCAPIAPKSGS